MTGNMTYDEALAWVYALARMGQKAGLGRMRRLLTALGDPQRRLRVVHIAGTNGKGSTVVMTASILKAAGYRVGSNLSPYVVDFRERFMINGEMIAPEELAAVLAEVRQKAAGLAEPLVHFEAVTAAALLWFARRECDIVCLETGIGGRLDSTNVVENTLVSCITRIGLDHTDLLGETLTQIAAEKCGILRPGVPAVSWPAQPVQAAAEIARQAAALGAPLAVPDAGTVISESTGGGLFSNRVNYAGLKLDIPFPGRHQAYNAAVAVEAARALRGQGFAITDGHIERGIAAARIPARIEVLGRAPLIIVDGAHNADGAQALAAALADAGLYGLTGVCGVLRDKQAMEILRAVAPHLDVLVTVAPDSPRAMPAAELAGLAAGLAGNIAVAAGVEEALEKALETPGSGVVVFGSLYLAGAAKKIIEKKTKKEVDTPKPL